MTGLKYWKFSLVFLGVLLLKSGLLTGQLDFPYRIAFKSMAIEGLPGLHSFAYAQHDGKWILLGGRTDGLHPRQPFNSFPEAHNNTMIYLVDPADQTAFGVSIDVLQSSLKDQLQSSNMQFYQDGETLILIGGYAYSNAAGDHITFPNLTVVDLPGLIDDLTAGNPVHAHFRQLEDEFFAVTGGVLGKIGDTYYLVGGHRFDGRYNPMNMPTFDQEYTNAIRKFKLNISGDTIIPDEFSAVSDGVHLHRRDYNLLPQVGTDGSYGYTIYSGVFQLNADLPFLYPVEITGSGYTAVPEFNQYLSNYHAAHVAIYEASQNAMHNLFFGGISQYFYKDGNMVENEDVPFVRTISRVSRDAGGQYAEYKLPIEMPSFLGASSEFLINPDLPASGKGIVDIDQIAVDSFLIGHMVGGIFSEAMNPFTFNNTQVTHAFDSVYQVYLVREDETTGHHYGLNGYHNFSVEAMPNPHSGNKFGLKINAPVKGQLDLYLASPEGEVFVNEQVSGLNAGESVLEIELEQSHKGIVYLTAVLEGRFVSTTTIVMH